MIDALIDQAAALQKQVEALAKEVRALRKEKEKHDAAITEQKEKLQQLGAQHNSLQSLLDVNSLATALDAKQDPAELRQRLNKLIRELDTVIRYLEKPEQP